MTDDNTCQRAAEFMAALTEHLDARERMALGKSRSVNPVANELIDAARSRRIAQSRSALQLAVTRLCP